MSDNKVEISINIGGEWKQLKHVDMGRDDQSVVRVLTVNGETVTLDTEKVKAFLKEQQQFHIDEANYFLSREAVRNLIQAIDIITATTEETNQQLEFYKKLAEQANQVGSRIAIMGGRQFGRTESHRRLLQILEHEIGNPTAPDQNCAFSFKPRRCDCLKCRMGQSHQCMTFSPKKRRGK